MPTISQRRGVIAAAFLSIGALGLTACGGSSSSSTPAAPATAAAAPTTPAPAAPATAAAAPTTPAAAAPATTPVAATPSAVKTTLTEYKIGTTPATVKAGRVTFDVTNTGKIKHQFTIIRTTKSAATVLSAQKPNDDIPGARGEIAALAAGASRKLVIKHLKAGHYALVCALPGHYQSGMHADFTVQ